MPTNDDPHSLRLMDSISTTINENAAQEFSKMFPLSKSVDFKKRFKWAKAVCEYLDCNFDEETKIKIRSVCNCEDGNTKAVKIKSYLVKTNSLEEFTHLFNSKESYARVEIEGNNLLYIYPQCYCSCVKRVDEIISKTWCYCTLGYAKALFEKVFECNVQAELLESIKTGGNRCVVRISKN